MAGATTVAALGLAPHTMRPSPATSRHSRSAGGTRDGGDYNYGGGGSLVGPNVLFLKGKPASGVRGDNPVPPDG
jgi:hypothetical protein